MGEYEHEHAKLELLEDVQSELRYALNSLGGRQADGLLQHYLFYSASHINKAVEGFIYLRRNKRVDASKLLIRTVLESFIRMRAIQKKPELLFRMAYSEFEEDKKWVRSINGATAEETLQKIASQWQTFKLEYQRTYPEHLMSEKSLKLREAATHASVESYYDSHYRLYCHFTHGAFRATAGDLNNLESEDVDTMIICAFAALDALNSIGASCPNFSSLERRISQTQYL